MTGLEKQIELGRELMELNTQWFRKIADFDSENFNKYIDINREFGEKLAEVKDTQGFVDLQREYGESLWNDTQDVMKSRGELLKQAAEETSAAWKKAVSVEEKAPKAKSHANKKAA